MQVIGTIRTGELVATRINDDFSWAEGLIQPQTSSINPVSERALLEAVLQSIEPVGDTELAYSACTDGRLPVRLMDDEMVPVREQLVGADEVSAFYVAETLGLSFYQDPDAPVQERVQAATAFLRENGLLPSSHVACGAGAGFVAVMQNIPRFAQIPAYLARQQALVPALVYDQTLHDRMMAERQIRLADSSLYQGLNHQMFLDAVTATSGTRAVAELKDDGRGVHGHVEEAIIRLRIPGYALNVARLAELTGGRQVFSVNDNRIERLARLFGRGNDDDYRRAYMALEDFADAGHATLAKDLPTWIIERA